MTFNFPTWYYTVNDSAPAAQVWEMSTGAFVGLGTAGFTSFLSSQNVDAQLTGLASTANNGVGLIRVQCISTVNFTTNMKVYFKGNQSGVSAAFLITVIDATHFDLQGSAFTVSDTTGAIYGATIIDTIAGLLSLIDGYNNAITPPSFLAVTSGVNYSLANTPPLVLSFTPTAANLTITLPQMNLAGSLAKGRLLRVINSGNFLITAKNFVGTTFGTIPVGGNFGVILTDNTTQPGTLVLFRDLENGYQTAGDTNYTIAVADTLLSFVGTTAAFTAARTWTLPAANAWIAGSMIIVADVFGAVSATNTLSVARAGADTINSGAGPIVLNRAHDWLALVTDGSAQWTIVGGKQSLASTDLTDLPIPVASGGTAYTGGAWTAWTPTVSCLTNSSAFASTTNAAQYLQIGKIVLFHFDISVTAASTGASGPGTVTSPVNASAAAQATGGFDFATGKMIGAGISGPIASSAWRIFYYDATSPVVTGARWGCNGVYESS